MRRRWSKLGARARWTIVLGGFAAALILWGAADQVALERFHDDRQARAIAQEEYDLVRVGESQGALLKRLGEPEDPEALSTAGEACVTYKEEGAALLRERTYRLCFELGRLTFKDFAPIEDPDLLTEGAVLEEP